jgi:ribosomal protein S10
LIDIVNPNAKTIDSLQRIELPAGVEVLGGALVGDD